GTAPSGHAEAREAKHRTSGIFGQYRRIAGRPPVEQLRAIHQEGKDKIRTNRANDLRNRILPRQVLTDQNTHRQPVAQRDKVDFALTDINTLPTVKGCRQPSPELVLQDLSAI